MPIGEARYIKKKVKTGTVDIHPTDNALVVNYEVEALILGDDGQPMIGDQKKCQKLIRFHSLNPATNCATLAKDVINKCKLIHPSKLDEVQHLLRYLQYRRQCAPSMLVRSNEAVDITSPLEENAPSKNEAEKGNLLDLEDYVELLYEEIADKIKGSNLILQLCKDSSNLDELTKNESLLSVLSRVLREDWKKSLDLSVNVVSVFEKFSQYSVFQHIILQQKVGSLCIEIITHEMKRYEEFKLDIVDASTQDEKAADMAKSLSFRSKLPVPRNAKSAVPGAEAQKKAKSQIPVKNSRRYSLVVEEPAVDQNIDQSSSRKVEIIVKKQDQLFHCCFSLLLNISENEKIEDKMRRRNIVSLLIQSLTRKSIQLLTTVVKFLHKLSVYRKNKDTMMSLNIVEKLPRILLLSMKDNNLLDHLLPFLFNLSFDRKLCEQMIRVGFLPEMVKLTEKCKMTKNRKYVLGLLYHFTMDDRVKSMFAYSDSMGVLIDMLLHPELGDDPVLKALCVNLALNNKCSESLCDHRVISMIMEKAFSHRDPVCVKMMRNIISHSSTKHMFEIYASEVAKSLKLYIHAHRHFTCECIGFLASLLTSDVDFCALFKKFQLFPLIKQCFNDLEFVTDDVRLEFLVLLGTVAYDEAMAEYLFQNDMLDLLIKHIKDKQEDDEIVLQVIFIFYQVLQHPLTRNYVTKHTDAPLYFIDLLHDNNPSIRKICRACLDIIKDFDDTWTDRVKMEKFQWHNSHWLEMIQSQMLNNSSSPYDQPYSSESMCNEDIMPQYNLLQQSLLLHSGSRLSMSVDGSMEVLSNNINSEESSQSLSEYNSDADLDMELMKNVSTPYDERYDLNEEFSNLVIDGESEIEGV